MFTIQRLMSQFAARQLTVELLSKPFSPSRIYTDLSKGSESAAEQTPYRTSSELVGGFEFDMPDKESVNDAILKAATFLDVTNFRQETNTWNVIRYNEGEEFKLHTDCWDAVKGEGEDQRVLTALIVLQQSDVGGETVFPRLGLTLKPQEGTVLVWRNTYKNMCDPDTAHAGLPVLKGTKLIMTKWFRGGAA